jgi:hypothetical protein
VDVFNGQQTAVVGTATSDQDGMVTFKAVPSTALVYVSHPLGYCRIEVADVRQAGSTALTAIVQPASPVTVALHPVTVAAGSISADGLTLPMSPRRIGEARFAPSSYGSYAASQPTPYLRLDDCIVWLDSLRTTPTCVFESSGRVSAMDFSFDPVGNPAAPAEGGPYSALLLQDQSRRVADYDPYDLRTLAAKHFIRRARPPAKLTWSLSRASLARAATPRRPCCRSCRCGRLPTPQPCSLRIDSRKRLP